MLKLLGGKRTPPGDRLSFITAGLYNRVNDPKGATRHRGSNRTTDQLHFKPNLPTIPKYGFVKVWSFVNLHDVDTTNVWDETNSGSGTSLTPQDARGGYAKVTNAATDNSYYFYESKYEIAKLSSSKGLWFRSHFKVGDADQADLFVGLCARLASGNLFDNRVDSIGFYLEDGSALLKIECGKNGTATQTTTTKTVSDGTALSLGIHVVSTSIVEFFAGEDYIGEIKTNLPDDTELAFSFGVRNGQASANNMSIGRTILLQDE